MKFLTIITPTYNRAHTLPRLYSSLKIQPNKFVWMIVDDGSTDNTENTVKNFINEKKIEIIYLKKENGGKHTALNFGIKEIQTPLTIIVDSDDWLEPNALNTIESFYNKYEYKYQIGVFSFLKGNRSGHPIVPLTDSEIIANYISYRIKNDRPGDMAEVFRTEILKKKIFPEFENEKFLSEDILWIEIAKSYDSLFVNKVIYGCEYLNDGLSSNDKKMKFLSPLGSMLRGKQLMTRACGIKANIKGAIIYNVYKIQCKVNKIGITDSLKLNLREKILTYLSFIPSIYFFIKWKKYI